MKNRVVKIAKSVLKTASDDAQEWRDWSFDVWDLKADVQKTYTLEDALEFKNLADIEADFKESFEEQYKVLFPDLGLAFNQEVPDFIDRNYTF